LQQCECSTGNPHKHEATTVQCELVSTLWKREDVPSGFRIVAALLAYILPSRAPKVIAYVSGVLGTLIGADLSNFNVIPELGALVASIGGAGTIDGVFLSGIMAVLLA
jgi:uncharacterized membrane protein